MDNCAAKNARTDCTLCMENYKYKHPAYNDLYLSKTKCEQRSFVKKQLEINGDTWLQHVGVVSMTSDY